MKINKLIAVIFYLTVSSLSLQSCNDKVLKQDVSSETYGGKPPTLIFTKEVDGVMLILRANHPRIEQEIEIAEKKLPEIRLNIKKSMEFLSSIFPDSKSKLKELEEEITNNFSISDFYTVQNFKDKKLSNTFSKINFDYDADEKDVMEEVLSYVFSTYENSEYSDSADITTRIWNVFYRNNTRAKKQFYPILNVDYDNYFTKRFVIRGVLNIVHHILPLCKSIEPFVRYLALLKKMSLLCKYELFYGDAKASEDAEKDYMDFLKLLSLKNSRTISNALETLEERYSKKYEAISESDDFKEKILRLRNVLVLSAKHKLVSDYSCKEFSSNKVSNLLKKISLDKLHIQYLCDELKINKKIIYFIGSTKYIGEFENTCLVDCDLSRLRKGSMLLSFIGKYQEQMKANENVYKRYLQNFDPEKDSENIDLNKLEYKVQNAKIGCEIEYRAPTSTPDRWLNKKEVIARSSENSYEIQADYDARSKRSDLEFVSDPFTLNKDGVEGLTKFGDIAKDMLQSIPKDNNDWYPMSNFASIDSTVQYKLNNASVEGTYETRTVPQFTLGMLLSSLLQLYTDLSENNDNISSIFKITSDSNFQPLNTFLPRYQNQPYVREIIGESNYNNTEIKGYLLLVYTYLHNFANLGNESLKNNFPMVSTRVGFDLLFQILPKEFQKRMLKNEGENFVKLMSFLIYDFPLGIDYMAKPLFEGKILHLKKDFKLVEFIPYLNKREWLKSILQGNDLLIAENHRKRYSKADKRDLGLMGIAFGIFGRKLESVNGKPAGIFELRHHSEVIMKDIPAYIKGIGEYFMN